MVDIEVLTLRLEGGWLHYRCARRRLLHGEAPDDAALRLAEARDSNAVCHSTSWRHEDGTVVLTYAVVPDPAPLSGNRDGAIVCSGDPLRPAPPDLHCHHVVAHAVRHLAYLSETAPAVNAIADADPEAGLWQAIRVIGPAVPADQHDAAHGLGEHRAAG